MALSKAKLTYPLHFERLEMRRLLTSYDVPWPEPRGMTLSFAPDGAIAGAQVSTLMQSLNQLLPTAVWQETILRAFQTWAVEADINIGLVPDGGQSFGSLGLKEGDLRFGDIRIGAFPMANDVLAVANPYDPFVANTWVGDVFLNSTNPLNLNAASQKAADQLYSIMLHEAGHVFGLAHSDDPVSPMFEQFHEVGYVAPTEADTAALRRLYGGRTPDANEGVAGNDDLSTAMPLGLLDTNGKPYPVEIDGDITNLTDADVFRFTIPEGATSLKVHLIAAEQSLLVARVSILDSAGGVVSRTDAAGPLDNELWIPVKDVKPGDTYFVRIESGRDDVFGIGRYGLAVIPKPNTSDGAGLPALGLHYDDPGLINGFLATTPGYVEHTYYQTSGALTSADPVKFYRVQSADFPADVTNVMTVVIEGAVYSRVRFEVVVRDDQGQVVPATTLVDDEGALEVQIASVPSNRSYTIEVRSRASTNRPSGFLIEVDFDGDGSHLQTFVNDSMGRDQSEILRTLQVNDSQQFHFVLSASDLNSPRETGVRLTIIDQSNNAVFRMNAADGATRSEDVFLNRGRYTVRFTRESADSDLPVVFQLSGTTTSDGLGPQLQDTTLQPVEPAVDGALARLGFYWLPFRPADRPDVAVTQDIATARLAVAMSSSRISFMEPRNFEPGAAVFETGKKVIQGAPSGKSAGLLPGIGQDRNRSGHRLKPPIDSLPAAPVNRNSKPRLAQPTVTSVLGTSSSQIERASQTESVDQQTLRARAVDRPLSVPRSNPGSSESSSISTERSASDAEAGVPEKSGEALNTPSELPAKQSVSRWTLGMGAIVTACLVAPSRTSRVAIRACQRLTKSRVG